MTSDEVGAGTLLLTDFPDKHKVWGIGPEITIPIATKTKLISLGNVR